MVDVVIAGGGTGGHTSPGLAVAALLRQRHLTCAWIGSHHGVEARIVPGRDVPYTAIPTGKLRRYWSWRNVADLLVNTPTGVLAAAHALRRLRPRVGFASSGAQRDQRINRAVGESLPALLAHTQVIHQCGDNPTTGDRAWLEGLRATLPPALAARYTLKPWVGEELAAIYAAATLVIG